MRQCFRMQQSIPGRPAAIREHGFCNARDSICGYIGNHEVGDEARGRNLPAGNPFQEIRRHPFAHRSRQHTAVLFDTVSKRDERLELSKTIDRMNHQYGVKTVGLAVEGSANEEWKTRHEHLTPNYLTDINQIMVVNV